MYDNNERMDGGGRKPAKGAKPKKKGKGSTSDEYTKTARKHSDGRVIYRRNGNDYVRAFSSETRKFVHRKVSSK